jgi:hypothetical protein
MITTRGWIYPLIDDMDTVYDPETDNTRPLSLDDCIFTAGKYKGMLLSEMDDVGYLRWLLGSAKEKDDWWLQFIIKKKLEIIT